MAPWRIRLVLVTIVLIAGCSDGGGGEASGADLKGQQIEVVAGWSGTDQERFSAVLSKFEERTGATVKFTSTGADIATVLGARLAAGQAPDVAVLPRPGLLGELARRGALKPLPKAAADLVDRNYDPLWRDLATVNGELFGVWFKATNKSTLWFNQAVLDGAGVKPPATWDELKAAATALAASGVAPFSVAGADGWNLTDWFENVYLRTAGSEAYIDLARHHLAWNDATVIEALALLGEVFRPDWLAGGPEGALQTGFTDSVAGVFADPPTAAFVLEADVVAGAGTGGTGATPGEGAGLVDFPSIGGSPPSVVVGGDVAVLMADTPGGRALVEFLATPEAAEVWAAQGGFTSPNKEVDPSAYATGVQRRAAEALTAAKVARYDMSDLQPVAFGANADQGLWKLFQDYLANPASAPDVARRIEQVASATFEP